MTNETKQQESERLAYDVPGFCEAVGISRSLFYDLQRDGDGPPITKLGDRHRRSLILAKDAQRWLEKRAAQSKMAAMDAREAALPRNPRGHNPART
jgi:predicted DNA-binding transcriptional regulator AlpA